MKQFAIILVWICVIVTAVFLRFDDLGSRPFHADEATGARITAQRMEGAGQFDPNHYHGPVLADVAAQVSRIRGESEWANMTKHTLRLVPALAGVLLVLLPLWVRRFYGNGVVLASAALLATSPLLVYYSRMFIHESLLILFGVAALLFVVRNPRTGLPGVMLGLMYATKESVVISILAWGMASVVLLAENRKWLTRENYIRVWGEWRMPAVVSLVLAGVVSMALYTDGFRHVQGAVDAVRTFFVYETVEGHDKSFGYYIELLFVPDKSGGIWWFGTPLVLLALIAYGGTFRAAMDARSKLTIRFLAYAALGHLLIYSLFAYKTPWLACLPWAHVCLLAGFAVHQGMKQSRIMQIVVGLLLVFGLLTQFRQARYATGRLSSDHRNPHAYVPTRKSVEKLETWLDRLKSMESGDELNEVAVIGSGYWPLPWYLRKFEQIGYWPQSKEGIEKFPLVMCMPQEMEGTMGLLSDSHHLVPFGYGLRPEVNVEVFVRMDVWKNWLAADEP